MEEATVTPASIKHEFQSKPIIRRQPVRSLKDVAAQTGSCFSGLSQANNMSDTALHPTLERVFNHRGIYGFSLGDYGMEHLLPPTKLKGLDATCQILYTAFKQVQAGYCQKIVVVGDFDVDGATSVVVALRGLRAMGFDVDFFIPDRFKLGYGLSPAVVEAAKSLKPNILMTVDNGIASVDGVAAAKACGWQVIITDHHLAGDVVPLADAIVNPNQPGCTFASKHLAGVGVMFYVLIGLRAYFRMQGVSRSYLPNLAQLLDIVALGTVADVVPLDENNRCLVSLGLARMRAGHACYGLQALAEVSGRDLSEISESDLGFAFGPRLNAAGRLEDMSIGVQCLLSENWSDALRHAKTLDHLNRTRRTIQQEMQEEADKNVAEAFDGIDIVNLPNALVVYQPDWHQGIVGLLASRLKDRWYRPVIALAQVSETELKGSGRSIPGVHLRDALDQISKRAPHVLSKFGGHAMAAGLSLEMQHFEEFKMHYQAVMCDLITPDMLLQTLLSDGELTEQELCLTLALDTERAGPWGQAFPEPAYDGEFRILSQQWLKEKHLKLILQPMYASQGSMSFEALYFNVPLTAYCADEDASRAKIEQFNHVRIVYKLQVNRFRGAMRLQLIIEYLEPMGR